jgi:DNA-binding response OmpR family regulator
MAGEITSSTRRPYLRRKIDDDSALRLIHTIRGVGYELSGVRK